MALGQRVGQILRVSLGLDCDFGGLRVGLGSGKE